MKTKTLITSIIFILFLTLSYTAHAESLSDYYEDVTDSDLKNSIILFPNSSLAFINGHKASAVQPIVKDGRTLVPLRFISEGFGAKVDFNSNNQSITIKHNDKTIYLKLGSKHISIDGASKQMEVAPRTHNNSTYLPLRDIGEIFNKKVIYLKNAESQYSLIILRDEHATAIEDLKLIQVCNLLNQGKSIVYSDRYMAVIKENGHLLIDNNFQYFTPFVHQEHEDAENIIRYGDIWFETDMGYFYLNYAYNTTKEFILYHVQGEEISRVAIEQAPIRSVKTYQNDIYYLTRYERGINNAHETSNLKSATFNNGKWHADYLGKPGFYYGFDTLGNTYDWQIHASGIFTFGYQRSGNLNSDERRKTFGNYRIELKGHQHELLKP